MLNLQLLVLMEVLCDSIRGSCSHMFLLFRASASKKLDVIWGMSRESFQELVQMYTALDYDN